jgi:hypothetical protein
MNVVGERKTIAGGHLAVNTLIKFQRGSLGLNNTTPLSSHVFNFALLQTRSSAQRPPFNSSSALRDPPRHGLPVPPFATSLLYAIPFAVPSMPFTNLVPDLLQPPTLLLSSAFARAGG